MNELKFEKNSLNDSEINPLEMLKKRIMDMQSGAKDSEPDSITAGFIIDTEDTADKKEADGAALKEETKAPEEVEEANEPEQPAPAKEEVKTVAADEESTEKSEKQGKRSFLKRMRRFTTNDNGVDVFDIEKPTYRLDPVDKILGIKNEQTEAESEASPEPAEPEAEASVNTSTGGTTPYISDIDMPTESEADEVPDRPVGSDTATIRFTPVSSETAKKASVKVDTMTHQFDLGGEFTEKQNDAGKNFEELEESEFDRFVPKEEILSAKDEKHFLHRFAVKKRNRFLAATACGLLTFVLIIFLILSISGNFYNGQTGMLIASTVILGIIILLNGDMFIKTVSAFSGDFNIDPCAAAASVSTMLLAVFSIKNQSNCFHMLLVCAFLLFIRSLSNYYSVSNYYGNLKVISVPRPKTAVHFINDESTVMAMAKDAIEGKVMAATSRKTGRVTDFMKYSDFGTSMFGKGKIITVISLALAVLSAVIAGLMKHSPVEAFYMSSVVLCAAALPTAFLIDVLPLRSAASRLNRIGAMLTGYAGADKLNQANAAVIKTSDIFPHGSVVLKDMKVLANCDADDILLRAASLTEAVSSPLSNIFKQIAKTNDAYLVPDSDTVKYEKRLGVSGWVNDELMFIGNRTLLEAHGINNIPSLDVDHEILKRDCFPVYVAKDNKACILLIIKYSANPDVARQLRTAAELGITLLIDNSDPNVTNEMVCDYFDLYEDSVSVMSGAGSSAHRAATAPVEECSAPAAYRGNSISLLQIMCSAAKVKKSSLLLTVIYVIAAVIGTVFFIYNSFLGNASIAERGSAALIFELAATAVSLAAFIIKKP